MPEAFDKGTFDECTAGRSFSNGSSFEHLLFRKRLTVPDSLRVGEFAISFQFRFPIDFVITATPNGTAATERRWSAPA
jgi:hypothetical protein